MESARAPVARPRHGAKGRASCLCPHHARRAPCAPSLPDARLWSCRPGKRLIPGGFLRSNLAVPTPTLCRSFHFYYYSLSSWSAWKQIETSLLLLRARRRRWRRRVCASGDGSRRLRGANQQAECLTRDVISAWPLPPLESLSQGLCHLDTSTSTLPRLARG